MATAVVARVAAMMILEILENMIDLFVGVVLATVGLNVGLKNPKSSNQQR